MIDSVAGVEIRPMPRPISTIWGTIVTQYDVSTSTLSAIHAIAVPKNVRPVTTTARVPTRGARMPPTTDAIAMEIATGRIRAPVESGPKSRTTWKYCVIRKMKPDSAKNVTVTAPLAALNRRSAKSLTSSIGCSAARSTMTNTATSTAAAVKPSSVKVLSQPCSGASITV